MRQHAFTLVEVMAVVTLLGLLAAATAWSLAGDARRGTRADVIGQIVHADRLARLAAQRSGLPCRLRIDMDAQCLWRVEEGNQAGEEASHGIKWSTDFRVARVILAPMAASAGQVAGDTIARVDDGAVDIGYSTGGRSVTYAVQLVAVDSGETSWLLFSGLTGQMTLIDHEDELDKLLAILATGRPDAD